MRRGPAAIQQARSSKQHCSGANGTDTPNSPSDGFQPADHFITYFIIFNRGPAGYEQSVDGRTQFAKSFVCDDSQTTIRDK